MIHKKKSTPTSGRKLQSNAFSSLSIIFQGGNIVHLKDDRREKPGDLPALLGSSRLAHGLGFGSLFPGKFRLIAAEMAVGGCLGIDGTQKIEVFDDRRRS